MADEQEEAYYEWLWTGAEQYMRSHPADQNVMKAGGRQAPQIFMF